VEITGIEYDSRLIGPGMLFVAVSGFKQDGKKFIADAIKNGAAAVMADSKIDAGVPVVVVPELRQAMADAAAEYFGYPGKKLFVIGITGTNGKSTSVYLIRMILEAAGRKVGMLNSLVYDTGEKRIKAERTTPDSVDMQRYLSDMCEALCEYASVEVSSHALVLHRVDNIDFKVGLFTNFSRDHLDFHHTMEEYLAAKKLFLSKLEGADKYAVINMDVAEFAGFTKDVKCNLVTYSVADHSVDVYVKDAELFPDRTRFRLVTRRDEREVNFRLPGRYNLANATGAAAAGAALGIDLDTIVCGLESAESVPGRFQPVNVGQPFAVIIDYAHTPDAIERLCQSAREVTKGRLMILFGCGGDRDRGKRPLMGEAASRFSDYAVITSDNPRTEDPLKIIDEIKPGMVNDRYLVIPNRTEAIGEILIKAAGGDTVLIAGKGAEDYQEIGTKKYPYEDRTEVIKALKNLGYREG